MIPSLLTEVHGPSDGGRLLFTKVNQRSGTSLSTGKDGNKLCIEDQYTKGFIFSHPETHHHTDQSVETHVRCLTTRPRQLSGLTSDQRRLSRNTSTMQQSAKCSSSATSTSATSLDNPTALDDILSIYSQEWQAGSRGPGPRRRRPWRRWKEWRQRNALLVFWSSKRNVLVARVCVDYELSPAMKMV